MPKKDEAAGKKGKGKKGKKGKEEVDVQRLLKVTLPPRCALCA